VSPSGVKPLERNGELTIATRLVHKKTPSDLSFVWLQRRF